MSSDADTEEDFLEIKDEETGIEPFKQLDMDGKWDPQEEEEKLSEEVVDLPNLSQEFDIDDEDLDCLDGYENPLHRSRSKSKSRPGFYNASSPALSDWTGCEHNSIDDSFKLKNEDHYLSGWLNRNLR